MLYLNNILVPIVCLSVSGSVLLLLALEEILKLLGYKTVKGKAKFSGEGDRAIQPRFLAKTLVEQVWMVGLMAGGIYLLAATDVLYFPFSPPSQQHKPYTLINLLFALNIGRYLFTIIYNSVESHSHFRMRLQTLEYLAWLMTYNLMVVSGENTISGLIGLLMEADITWIYLRKLVRMLGMKKYSRQFFGISVTGCVVMVLSRGVAPLIILAIALANQSVLVMQPIPLGSFFFCMVFFTIINICKMIYAIKNTILYRPSSELEEIQTTFRLPPIYNQCKQNPKLETLKTADGFTYALPLYKNSSMSTMTKPVLNKNITPKSTWLGKSQAVDNINVALLNAAS